MTVSTIAAAIAILQPHYPGVGIGTRFPNDPDPEVPRPDRFIRLSRAGGDRDPALDHPRLLVEFLDVDEVRGEVDCYRGYDILAAAGGGGPYAGGWVTGWEGNTIAQFDDPDLPGHTRWQFSGSLHILTRS
ncbi:hypothetical protein [Gordonia sp. 4N]|uniref:hypothetical protein n=1 Tax=Gordonia sp. 4N TaxID=2993508 RepID=UPI000EB71F51|nr:hypothetical protein [Gordonia sp. 4N]AXQ62844.1 tail terminator [Gordonia phage Angelique]MCX2753079.1 hypothetical protein [Gordonia sp. 4N]